MESYINSSATNPINNQNSEIRPAVIKFQSEVEAKTPNFKSEMKRFFLGVVTVGLSEMGRYFAGHVLAGGTVPGFSNQLSKSARQQDTKAFEDLYDGKNNLSHSEISQKIEVTTYDGAKLKGKVISFNKSFDHLQHPSDNDQKYVIWLNGLGGSYEAKLKDAVEYSYLTGANVLLFNYRGAGGSKGYSTEECDFVTDTLSMVELLTESGVRPENITIHGYSLGGGIGAQATAQLEKVKHINDRSFESLSKASKHNPHYGRKTGKAVSFLIKRLGFEYSTKKVLEKIEDRTLIINHKDDLMMENSSLKEYIDKQPVKNSSTLKDSHKVTDEGQNIRYPIKAVELKAAEIEKDAVHKAQLLKICDELDKKYQIKDAGAFIAFINEDRMTYSQCRDELFHILKRHIEENKSETSEQSNYYIQVMNDLNKMFFLSENNDVHEISLLRFQEIRHVIEFVKSK